MWKVFVLSFVLVTTESARILGIWMFPGGSHWLPVEPLFQELAARGHQVTVFSSFPQKTLLSNYTDVDFSDRLPYRQSSFSIDMIKNRLSDPFKTTSHVFQIHDSTCKMLEEPEFQELIKSKGQYDLLITELFGTECFSYISHKLNIPMVSFTPCLSMPWASGRTGLPDNPSYIPNNHLSLSPEITLWQRAFNTLVYVYTKFCHQWVFAMKTQESTEKRFGEDLPSVHEVVNNTSILLLNTYHAIAQSRPFPPNVIEVGGIHITKKKSLSKDMQHILDTSEHGVIVMSFGSLVRSSTLPKSTILMFMKAFAKIPQTVLFKYEEELPEAPPNVVVRKWLPQRDLVEDDRVLAVIGHGGLHSTIEAVYFGKPLVGVPFFGDQPVNVAAVERRGAGVALDLDTITQGKIEHALDQVINNPTYKENMKQLSLQFRDRPMSPLDTAVFWIEYVIRHKGAHHLRPASVNLPFYQYLLLDVAALAIAILSALMYTAYFICKTICRRFKSPKKTKLEIKTKKIN